MDRGNPRLPQEWFSQIATSTQGLRRRTIKAASLHHQAHQRCCNDVPQALVSQQSNDANKCSKTVRVCVCCGQWASTFSSTECGQHRDDDTGHIEDTLCHVVAAPPVVYLYSFVSNGERGTSSSFELHMLPLADRYMPSFSRLLRGRCCVAAPMIHGSRPLLHHAKQSVCEFGCKLSCHLVNREGEIGMLERADGKCSSGIFHGSRV